MATLYGTKLRAAVLACLAAGALVTTPASARAEEVTPTAKGVVGGALLGGEVVVFGGALFGLRSKLAYAIGAGAGAVGGGIGGYYLEQGASDGRVPAYVLAGGLALLIPAVVVGLDATRYMPTEGAREDRPVELPSSDPGKPGGSSVLGAEPSTAAPPAAKPAPASPTGGGTGGAPPAKAPQVSLIHMGTGGFALGVPVPEVRPIVGAVERARLGVQDRGSELRFPVVRFTF